MYVGNKETEFVKKLNWDFEPIVLKDDLLKQICKDLEISHVCSVRIRLENKGKESVSFSYLAWRKGLPFELRDGEPFVMQTDGAGRELHLYYKVGAIDKPINIHVYSNEVHILAESFVYKPQQTVEVEDWPFPLIASKAPTNESNELTVAHSFHHLLYFGTEELQKTFKDAAIRYVLLTIRLNPDTTAGKKGRGTLRSGGFLHIVATSGSVDLRVEDKM
jgi:hypothetical protein